MTIIDRENGWEWDFWQVAPDRSPTGGTMNMSWGGRTEIGTPESDGLGSDATAAWFGLLGGIIRAQELEEAYIDHALFLVVPCVRVPYVYPAMGNAAECEDPAHAPADGERFYLEISEAEIDALPLPPWKKAIVRALAIYGGFVGDTGHSRINIMLESDSTYTSYGYPGRIDAFGESVGWSRSGDYRHFPIDDLPWDRLRVLDPCVTEGTCE